MIFLNLTNGIEALTRKPKIKDYRFIRIQSTWCEQKRWADILWTLSDDFLMYAAMGYECRVIDYSAHRRSSRAIWQGLEWIRYCLARIWFDHEHEPTGRCQGAAPYFKEQYDGLPPRVLVRLKYYSRYLPGGARSLNIYGESWQHTDNDGKTDYYRGVIAATVGEEA